MTSKGKTINKGAPARAQVAKEAPQKSQSTGPSVKVLAAPVVREKQQPVAKAVSKPKSTVKAPAQVVSSQSLANKASARVGSTHHGYLRPIEEKLGTMRVGPERPSPMPLGNKAEISQNEPRRTGTLSLTEQSVETMLEKSSKFAFQEAVMSALDPIQGEDIDMVTPIGYKLGVVQVTQDVIASVVNNATTGRNFVGGFLTGKPYQALGTITAVAGATDALTVVYTDVPHYSDLASLYDGFVCLSAGIYYVPLMDFANNEGYVTAGRVNQFRAWASYDTPEELRQIPGAQISSMASGGVVCWLPLDNSAEEFRPMSQNDNTGVAFCLFGNLDSTAQINLKYVWNFLVLYKDNEILPGQGMTLRNTSMTESLRVYGSDPDELSDFRSLRARGVPDDLIRKKYESNFEELDFDDMAIAKYRCSLLTGDMVSGKFGKRCTFAAAVAGNNLGFTFKTLASQIDPSTVGMATDLILSLPVIRDIAEPAQEFVKRQTGKSIGTWAKAAWASMA